MSGKKKRAAEDAARRQAEADKRHTRAVLRGYQSALALTAEQRSERASKAGKASAEKRAAERAALGITPKSTGAPVAKGPTANELSDFFEEFDRQNPDLEATYEVRRRGALILMRKHFAELGLK